MKMTKIKRRDLKHGDLYALELDSTHGVPQVYVALVDGVTIPINVANETIYRIGVPDYTHELTQFSWELKQLDDKVESLTAHNNRKGALVDVIKTRDERIEELEDMDKRAKTSVDYKNHCIDGLLIDQATMQDTAHQLRMKIFDIEGREDLVTTELEHQIELSDAKAEGLEDENRGLIKAIAKNDGTSLVNLEECQRSNRSMRGTIKALTKSDLKQLEKDELLASTKRAYESLHQRYDECQQANRSLQNTNDILSAQLKEVLSSTTNEQVENLECANIDLYNETMSLQMNVSTRDDRIKQLEAMLCDVSNPYAIAIDESIKHDLELLDSILKRANPMIRTGMWRTTVGSCEFMRDVCQDVIDFRRKYNIVG